MPPSRDGAGRDGTEPGRESRRPRIGVDVLSVCMTPFFLSFFAWRTYNSIPAVYMMIPFVLPHHQGSFFSYLSFCVVLRLVVLGVDVAQRGSGPVFARQAEAVRVPEE
ncbi:unnamed protein product [Ectocarpus sp. 12 AP-2014]